MTKMQGPLPAIDEAHAIGETAALFADIRQTLGVPVVNLIFRHLATQPELLAWCWQALKPVYLNGAIDAQAKTLRDSLMLPAVQEFGSARFAQAGLTQTDQSAIALILRSYERSNAMNLIAFSVLLASLNGDKFQATENQLDPPLSEPVTGEMPTPLAISEMSARTGALVDHLANIGGPQTIMPTMYRHLAHWPTFLALISELLTPMDENGLIHTESASVLRSARSRGASIGADLGQPSVVLDARGQRALTYTIEKFTHGMIAKMIVIVGLIHKAMPEDD